MTSPKHILRREAIRHRDMIDPGGDSAEAVTKLFMDTIAPQAGQTIALYWPKGREFDCRDLLHRLLSEGFTCALPVVREGSKELGFAAWDEATPLKEGVFGVMQPQPGPETKWVEPDIVGVPLLAFDTRGYRLGYGGGYYDTTLERLRAKKSILAVGLAYAQQAVLFALPTDAHDQKLDWVITPMRAHRFK